jgi:hypothetical protein
MAVPVDAWICVVILLAGYHDDEDGETEAAVVAEGEAACGGRCLC